MLGLIPVVLFVLNLCGLVLRSTHMTRPKFSGLVHEEIHPFFLSSLRGRQLLSCLALRLQIGPNALPLTNQNPTTKAKGYILLKKGKRKSKKHYPSYIKE